jgi:hypothetical protein
MALLCVACWRSARGMIEWICTQERWDSKLAIIFGAAARYRRAKVVSSHDDAHRIIKRCTRGRFALTPALWRASFHIAP